MTAEIWLRANEPNYDFTNFKPIECHIFYQFAAWHVIEVSDKTTGCFA